MLPARVSRLQSAMENERFVCYSPTVFNPLPGPGFLPASREVLLADLQEGRRYFSALITYGCSNGEGLALIPHAAREINPPYRGLILGLYDINNHDEFETAVHLAREHEDLILAVCCGNEGLYFDRYTPYDLRRQIGRLRERLPDSVCVTTAEPVPETGKYPVLQGFALDFHHPTLHPWFFPDQRARGAEAAADWVAERIRAVQAEAGLPLLLKETGWPSGGSPGASPEAQKAFWRRLASQMLPDSELALAYFELYDSGDWKCVTNEFVPEPDSTVETNWGFYTISRKRKPVLDLLTPLADSTRPAA